MLHNISAERVFAVYRDMSLPEPFAWALWEDGALQGLSTGFVYHEAVKYAHLEHMIVLPDAKRKFHAIMALSTGATQAAFSEGCEYIVLSVLHSDSRRAALAKWAARCGYRLYSQHNDADWFIRHRPTKEDHNGQALPPEAAAAPRSA